MYFAEKQENYYIDLKKESSIIGFYGEKAIYLVTSLYSFRADRASTGGVTDSVFSGHFLLFL